MAIASFSPGCVGSSFEIGIRAVFYRSASFVPKFVDLSFFSLGFSIKSPRLAIKPAVQRLCHNQMLAPNTVLQDRYRIIRQLGHGGMGAVYEALNERVSSLVALKETFATTDQQRDAFEREAKLLANLDHEAFPRVMDHFFEGEGQYLVMELVRGDDLWKMMQLRGAPFTTEEVLEWADQLLDALHELHTNKPPIVHRDIKPANVKLTPRGKIKLLDFGIAKGTSGQMEYSTAEPLSVIGFTPHFAPLEQVLRSQPFYVEALEHLNADAVATILQTPTDARSDLYSLGATLYHLLTNQMPSDAAKRALAVWSGRPDHLVAADTLNPLVPAHVARALGQALALERVNRPASANEMRITLRNAGNGGRQPRTVSMAPTVMGAAPDLLESETLRVSSAEAATQVSGGREPETNERESSMTAEGNGSVSELEKPTRVSPPLSSPALAPTCGANPVADQALRTSPEALPPFRSAERHLLDGLSNNASQKTRLIGMGLAIVLAIGSVIGGILWWTKSGTNSGTSTSGPSTSGNAPATRPGTTGPTAPEGMVFVPGGEFLMGRNAAEGGDEYESPAHPVTVPPFFIDLHEVTNEEYRQCVDARQCPAPEGWTNNNFPSGAARRPVTGVHWEGANTYAAFVKKRLPTEAEWEFAARGSDARLYPWGNDWRQGQANADSSESGMVDVGKYPGASPFGALDMVGNAWEWTADDFRGYPGGTLQPESNARNLKVIRGGSWKSDSKSATTTYRFPWPAMNSAEGYTNTGLRCAKDANR